MLVTSLGLTLTFTWTLQQATLSRCDVALVSLIFAGHHSSCSLASSKLPSRPRALSLSSSACLWLWMKGTRLCSNTGLPHYPLIILDTLLCLLIPHPMLSWRSSLLRNSRILRNVPFITSFLLQMHVNSAFKCANFTCNDVEVQNL